MFVIGTAGHVDHGKSTLVATLTGLPVDRLAQEKARGMTLDLNFAHLSLPDFPGEKIGVVDVPGHKRFVKNMVSGVAALDAFLFVVAADDGWMPQSEEHLRILAALGICHGVVVLTKIDLVDEAHRAEVEREILAQFSAAELPAPKIVSFSSRQPATAYEVKRALSAVLLQLPARNSECGVRLWVDRSFVPQGEGVVVTGTLLEGSLHVGQTLYAWPAEKTVTVRGLQAYGEKAERVRASSRVALALGGATLSDLERGTLLTDTDKPLTAFFEGRLGFWKKIPKRNFTAYLHAGTGKVAATLIDVGGGFRVKVKAPWPLRSGDRFLIRASGEEQSLGGGQVTDPCPGPGTKAEAAVRIATYKEGAAEWLAQLEAKCPVVNLGDLRNSRFWTDSTEQTLCDTKRFLRLPPHSVLRKTQYIKVTEPWHSKLAAQAQKTNEPLSPGELAKGLLKEVQARWALPAKTARTFLTELVALGEGEVWLAVDGGFMPKGVTLTVSPALERAKAEAIAILAKETLGPTSLKEWVQEDKTKKTALRRLATQKVIVGLGDGFYLSAVAFVRLSKRVAQFLKVNPGASTPALRDALGLSRRDAVLLLEKLDGEGITRFSENGRTLTPLAERLL